MGMELLTVLSSLPFSLESSLLDIYLSKGEDASQKVLEKNGFRKVEVNYIEPHYHQNASELVYIISGSLYGSSRSSHHSPKPS